MQQRLVVYERDGRAVAYSAVYTPDQARDSLLDLEARGVCGRVLDASTVNVPPLTTEEIDGYAIDLHNNRVTAGDA